MTNHILGALAIWLLVPVSVSRSQDTNPPDSSRAAQIQEAYQLSRTAETVEDLSRVIELCVEAGRPGATKDQVEYLRKLTSWTQNRRGELFVEKAAESLANGEEETARKLDAQALADFEAAIKNDPKRWKAYHNRGVSRGVQRQFDEALRDFNQALQLNPEYANTWFNRGEIRFELGQFADALSDYDRAVQMVPDDPGFRISRGHVLFQLRQFDAALSDYRRAVQLAPNSGSAYANRGDAYRSLGRWEEAANDYRRAIDLEPNLARAYQSAAWLMATCPDEKFRNAELSVQAAERATELSPEVDYVMLDTLAAAYANAGEFDKAKEQIAKAIQIAPEDFATRLKERAQLYASRRPYRQDSRTAEPVIRRSARR